MLKVTTHSVVRRSLLAVTAAVVVALAGAVVGHASTTAGHVNILRVTAPMALPGRVLPPGEYVFEIANPETSHDVVRVWNRATRQPVFLGFTRQVARPRTLASNEALTFEEAVAGEPVPVRAWYPLGLLEGHEFIYR